jgi:hypothetical protein
VPLPPAVGEGAAAARALGVVLSLPGEALPGIADREPGVAEPVDVDPTTPVFVVAVGENVAPRGVTVVGAGVVAAEPVEVVVLVGAPVMLPVLIPVCPLTWPAAGTASPTLSSKANLNECAIAIPLPGRDYRRSNGSLGRQFHRALAPPVARTWRNANGGCRHPEGSNRVIEKLRPGGAALAGNDGSGDLS